MTINNIIKAHISNGNSKLGNIGNWSVTPGRTCSACACKTCLLDGCYALDSYNRFPTTRAAWDENTELAMHNLPALEAILNAYFAAITAPRYFRVHVGGDFFSREYAEMWARVAAAAPGTRFLAFTKQWDCVRGVAFPENFKLILSAWPGTEIPADLLALYHVAWLDDGTVDGIPADAIVCPGKCETCGTCWNLDHDTVFIKHGRKARRAKSKK